MVVPKVFFDDSKKGRMVVPKSVFLCGFPISGSLSDLKSCFLWFFGDSKSAFLVNLEMSLLVQEVVFC